MRRSSVQFDCLSASLERTHVVLARSIDRPYRSQKIAMIYDVVQGSLRLSLNL